MSNRIKRHTVCVFIHRDRVALELLSIGLTRHELRPPTSGCQPGLAYVHQQGVRSLYLTPARSGVEVDSLSVTGRNGTLPHNLSFRAHPGEVTVLRGPNGTGKSTTFLAILGAPPDTDVSGRVAVGGEVAFLAARPATVPGTVRENLELFGAPVTPTPLAPTVEPESFIDPASRVLSAVGFPFDLDFVLDNGADSLSAGQRRRLLLARALCSDADVLLLDEPTVHLTPDDSADLMHMLLNSPLPGPKPQRTVIVVAPEN
ncbi:ATP-binding cassette domain-containing protein [Corynebacterium amycolatum]|nr:ATP-binding cassette domain-containing protein [Corynebacterium amycolatum]MCQ9167857.1 ATP-binding cassette domain-containing protein [Corynebacterium amycolatum]MCQ9173641.1 ATP-binding cassette domain-containing protein [Corynebacterium amycolatum]